MNDLVDWKRVTPRGLPWCNVCNKPVDSMGWSQKADPIFGYRGQMGWSEPYDQTITVTCHGESITMHRGCGILSHMQEPQAGLK